MRLDLSLSQRPELRLQLSPQLIQRIEILQLPTLDLQELISQELLENEAIELKEPAAAAAEPPKEGEQAAQTQAQEGFDEEDVPGLDWREYYSPARTRARDGEVDPKLEAMQNTADRPMTLQEHLEDQLVLMEIADDIRDLTRLLIYNLDAKGYLRTPLEEILIPLDDRFSLEQAQRALRVLQSLEPKGIGARDEKECLLLQLDPEHPRYELLRRLIMDHLEDLSKNRLPKVAKETGESLEAIKDMIGEFRHFDPTPGSRFSVEQTHYINPDVVVELVGNRYEVKIEDSYYPKLRVSQNYMTLLRDKSVDPELRRRIKKNIESAKWLIESIEQRKSTLYRVASEIVSRQQAFFDHGVNHLKPLKMQEVADTLGIHVSTVSRAISDKYLQSHRGILAMKFFFTGAAQGDSGVVESRAGVKQKVKEIIDQEDKQNPLSDEEIVDKLKAMGLDIARRTVTKYRKALKIPSSRQRREY
ncbi:MAG: RNA polymerase factor sigma-54 [Planctomycetota bacterium]